MLKLFSTNVVVSKGYKDKPALRFSENGESVRFRIGKKIYDNRVEGNYRWINLSVKAFGAVCERIEKMKLKEGSFINLTGRLDEDVWTDKETTEEKHMMVIVVEDIEYAFSGGKSGENQNPNQSQGKNQPTGQYQQAPETKQTPKQSASATSEAEDPMESQGFMGFEAFGGNNLFQEG